MTQEPNKTPSPSENKEMPKLSLVSEGQSSPDNSPQVVPPNGPQTELTPEERKHLAKAMKAMAKRGMKPAPGFTWNPLRKLGPNIPCPCLSEKKFKACCRDKLVAIVPESVAKEFEAQMARPDLVFLTPENHDKIQARIAPHVKAELEKQKQIADEKAAFEKRRLDDAIANSKR